LRYFVDPQRGFYACTYFYPGVFDAKLLLDTSIITHTSLVIPSDGWLVTIDQPDKEIPIYLRGETIDRNDHLVAIPRSVIESYGLDRTFMKSSIYRIGGFESLETEEGFTLTTSS